MSVRDIRIITTYHSINCHQQKRRYCYEQDYFLSTATDDEARVDARAVNGFEGWIACFPKAHLAGTVFAGGVNGVGEINGHSALEKAYEMGKGI